jgi:hypothetical protein
VGACEPLDQVGDDPVGVEVGTLDLQADLAVLDEVALLAGGAPAA